MTHCLRRSVHLSQMSTFAALLCFVIDSYGMARVLRLVCKDTLTLSVRSSHGEYSVQLLLLMSQYLQGSEHSVETWNIHGLAVKAAYQLGLHSSKALQRYPPLEREIRKRTWYGCVMLDRQVPPIIS